MKVWIIEQGCYSDYSVVGIFSTKENADMVCAEINKSGNTYDEAEVNSRDLDPFVNAINEGLIQFTVTMDYDGTVETCDEDKGIYLYSSELSVWKRTTARAYRNLLKNDAVHGSVFAKDKEHAIKITNEFRAMKIANNGMNTHNN